MGFLRAQDQQFGNLGVEGDYYFGVELRCSGGPVAVLGQVFLLQAGQARFQDGYLGPEIAEELGMINLRFVDHDSTPLVEYYDTAPYRFSVYMNKPADLE